MALPRMVVLCFKMLVSMVFWMCVCESLASPNVLLVGSEEFPLLESHGRCHIIQHSHLLLCCKSSNSFWKRPETAVSSGGKALLFVAQSPAGHVPFHLEVPRSVVLLI